MKRECEGWTGEEKRDSKRSTRRTKNFYMYGRYLLFFGHANDTVEKWTELPLIHTHTHTLTIQMQFDKIFICPFSFAHFFGIEFSTLAVALIFVHQRSYLYGCLCIILYSTLSSSLWCFHLMVCVVKNDVITWLRSFVLLFKMYPVQFFSVHMFSPFKILLHVWTHMCLCGNVICLLVCGKHINSFM